MANINRQASVTMLFTVIAQEIVITQCTLSMLGCEHTLPSTQMLQYS